MVLQDPAGDRTSSVRLAPASTATARVGDSTALATIVLASTATARAVRDDGPTTTDPDGRAGQKTRGPTADRTPWLRVSARIARREFAATDGSPQSATST